MPSTRTTIGLAATLLACVLSALPGRAQALDPHALPLGDGRVSTSPVRGDVYSCRTQFRGGGARHAGPWIHGSTWDPGEKISVEGEVLWPDARFRIDTVGATRRITGNDLPVNEPTGIFPIRPSDPAYAIDRNPNAVEPQHIDLSLPRDPQLAAQPSCVPMGMVGVMLDGVALFNALDDGGRDAVAHEVQDRCNGHPQSRGEYHYHGPSPCVPGEDGDDVLIGYALDGFGITSERDAQGRELTDADLDACHGRVSPVRWDGRTVVMYHYVLTKEYPYTIGCFRGTPVHLARPERRGPPRGRRRGGRGPMRRPPPEAIAACAGAAQGDACEFTTPRGNRLRGSCRAPGETLACVPRPRR